MNIDKSIEEMKKLIPHITFGPWYVDHATYSMKTSDYNIPKKGHAKIPFSDSDKHFIVLARNIMKDLLESWDELQDMKKK